MLSIPLAVVVSISGMLIGAIGIGGVLLVPALKYLGGIPIHTAIPACMVGYIATGIVGAIIFARHGSIDWGRARSVCLGALPGAFIGALLLPWIPALMLEIGIVLLLFLTGIHSLRRPAPSDGDQGELPLGTVGLIAIGFVTGAGSALTGTGGPLLLIPILIWFGAPVLTAIGLAQAVQIPVSLMATAGNLSTGELDLQLGLVLGIVLGIGAIIGALTAHRLPVAFLKKLVSWVLIAVGVLVLYRLF